MSTDPKVLIAVVCLTAISLLLILIVRRIRRRHAENAAVADIRTVVGSPAAAPSALSEPVALAESYAVPGAEGPASPIATNRASGLGSARPRYAAAPGPEASGRKVIAVIHDFGHPRDYPTDQRRYLTTREAFEILAEIRAVPADAPIDFVLHTPGGEAFACELIASAIKDRPNTTAYVPYCAMSAGTIIALATEKIVMGRYACLGPIDTQFYGFPIESYIRLLKEKPIASVDDEIVLLGYLAEKEMKTARARACELLNKAHFGKDDACRLTDFLVKGDMPHSEQISRERAIEIGVNVVGGDCPASVYGVVEQRLQLLQPMDSGDGYGPGYQVRATMLGNIQPPAGADHLPGRSEFGGLLGMSKLGAEEILRRVVDAACAYVVKKFAERAPTKAEVRALEVEIRAYVRAKFDKFAAFIDAHWAEIFEKIVAVFPD